MVLPTFIKRGTAKNQTQVVVSEWQQVRKIGGDVETEGSQTSAGSSEGITTLPGFRGAAMAAPMPPLCPAHHFAPQKVTLARS